MAPILSAHAVSKSFQDGQRVTPVLNDVSLSVEPGEIVCLEGRSGSGKTSLLSILGCILTPDRGHVVIEGSSVDVRRPRLLAAIRRRSIGFVFQQFNLFQALTSLENVEYGLQLRGISGAAARREAQRTIEAVGLDSHRNVYPNELSGGQKQRVAIARAMAGGAPILLADEPTANLDSTTAEAILDLFKTLVKRERRTLVVVTHDANVRAIADRGWWMQDGRLSKHE